jgi:hypothetical protein
MCVHGGSALEHLKVGPISEDHYVFVCVMCSGSQVTTAAELTLNYFFTGVIIILLIIISEYDEISIYFLVIRRSIFAVQL